MADTSARLRREGRVISGRRRSSAGQATLEYVIVYGAIIVPLTFGIIFTAQLLWVWHSVVDFTRQGAQYAATHCWSSSGENVISWMRANVPPMVDMERIRSGEAEIEVRYFQRNAETGVLEDFVCDGGECSTACVPDAVTVRLLNYEYRHTFLTYLGLPPVQVPDFRSSIPIESAGCSADAGAEVTCTP